MVTLIDVTPHHQAQGPSERFTFWGAAGCRYLNIFSPTHFGLNSHRRMTVVEAVKFVAAVALHGRTAAVLRCAVTFS